MGIAVIYHEKVIAHHVARVAREIAARQYDDLLFVTLLNGGAIFSADLARSLWHEKVSIEMQYISASIYNDDCSRKQPEFNYVGPMNVRGRNVLLVDDTFGTGDTYTLLKNFLIQRGAVNVALAVVIHATGKGRPTCSPDFACFTLPENAFFRVGYGEDVNGRLREVPFIGEYWE